MSAFKIDANAAIMASTEFRHIRYTSCDLQYGTMVLAPGGESTGTEVHKRTAQFFIVVAGTASFDVAGEKFDSDHGAIVIVPRNTPHTLTNKSTSAWLRVHTLYTNPLHDDGEREKRSGKRETDADDDDSDAEEVAAARKCRAAR